MLILVRHSNDEQDDPSYVHDNKLTDSGKDLAYKISRDLITDNGYPTIIYCSPFRRTKQTLKYMLAAIPKSKRSKISIIYSNKLSRFFHPTEKLNPDISPNTADFNIPIQESWFDFTERCIDFVKYMAASNHLDNKNITWCITHTTMYKRIARIYSIPLDRYIPYMDNYILSKRNFEKTKIVKKYCDSCHEYHHKRAK